MRNDCVPYLNFSEDGWPEMKFSYALNWLRDQVEDSLEMRDKTEMVSPTLNLKTVFIVIVHKVHSQ